MCADIGKNNDNKAFVTDIKKVAIEKASVADVRHGKLYSKADREKHCKQRSRGAKKSVEREMME